MENRPSIMSVGTDSMDLARDRIQLKHATFYCDRCAFMADPNGSFEIHLYVLPGGDCQAVHTRLGWCTDCRNLEWMEDLDPARAQAEADAWEGKLAEIDAGIARAEHEPVQPNRMTLYLGLFNHIKPLVERPIRDNPATGWDRHLAAWTLEAKQKHLQFCRDRITPARCLECGSTRISDFHHYLKDGRTEYPRRLEIEHPGCGGRLWAREQDTQIVRHVTRYYTTDGTFIREKLRYPERGEFDTETD